MIDSNEGIKGKDGRGNRRVPIVRLQIEVEKSVEYLRESLAAIPEIFKVAIITNAVSIILFYNHLSGAPTPSQSDRELTRSLREAGELLDMELADHIIIGSNGAYYSFMDNNRLDGSKSDGI